MVVLNNTKTALVELVNVCKEYRVEGVVTMALKDVNFKVYEKDLVAIMGPSGSGKTTLLNMLGLLDRPTSGKIIFDSQDISKLSDKELANLRNTKLGFVFQTFNLINRLTVFENVELPLIPKGLSRNVRAKMVEEALIKVGGGTEWLKKRPNQLSGGQQQRVAIARAIVGRPAVILADEPTGNLDRMSAKIVITTLLELNKEGHTVIIVTHDPEVANCTQKIYVIRDGTIVGEYRPNPDESLIKKLS
ncbi:ABC transporter ATP-binding protein [Candidatus Bathyarchaeota archaeon]|nr:ABC transporter ATP-binding protein [Candidatus Bathyarchaeota archaeon]MBS7613017.1 ABC transporter ATP-binding protein [Candidatus Bathyarchaeota archaeon]MBS7617642.1 ABC transporter ATP-binding protein [Candidatus Bathyarchaeota archaeon]